VVLVDGYQCFRGTCCFSLQGRRDMKMETTGSTEMLVPFFHTTWCGIPEDRSLDMHHGENLKYHIKRYDDIK
jgi:hypothetical protein